MWRFSSQRRTRAARRNGAKVTEVTHLFQVEAFFGLVCAAQGLEGAIKLLEHLEGYVAKETEKEDALLQLELEKSDSWAVAAASLIEDEEARIQHLFTSLDELGDGNGTIELEELELLDKRGKMYAKIDASNDAVKGVAAARKD